MSSVPTSPTSPTNRRSVRLSGFDILQDASPSPYTSGTTQSTLFSRRSSRTSQTSFMNSPITPRPTSARSSRPSSQYHRRKSSSRLSIGSNISFEANGDGLGNLADELEDALEDGYEINGSGYLEDLREGSAEPLRYFGHDTYGGNDIDGDDYESHPYSPAYAPHSVRSPNQLSPTKSKAERRKIQHQRTSSQYGELDFRPIPDQDEDGFPPALAKRMRDIETLARTGINTEDTLSEGGGAVSRTTNALKDLGPQASIEAHLSRIISAYTSMATHRTHKTRDIFTQAHSLLYGNAWELSEDVLDALLLELEVLSSSTTFMQQQNPLLSLQLVASQTLDLAQSLRSLTDTLQESRIQTNTASRKLKNVRDMVDDICTEHELVETSMMLIQAGDWDRRCRERQAAATCREVILGFGKRWDLEVDDRPWTREREGIVL